MAGAGMPRRVGHQCAAPGCAAVVRHGAYCAAHQRPKVDHRPSRSQRGYDRTWQRLRQMVLAAEPLCRACLASGAITPATQVDHIRPLSAGGENTFDNLQSLCHSCHSRKTAADRVIA